MNEMLILTLGHRYRADDAAGPLVFDALKDYTWPKVKVEENTGDMSCLIEYFQQYPNILIVDALFMPGNEAGKILRMNGLQANFSKEKIISSTHTFSLAQVIDLAKALSCLPQHLTIYGIVGKCFDHGLKPCKEVVKASKVVANTIRTALDHKETPDARTKFNNHFDDSD